MYTGKIKCDTCWEEYPINNPSRKGLIPNGWMTVGLTFNGPKGEGYASDIYYKIRDNSQTSSHICPECVKIIKRKGNNLKLKLAITEE